LKTLHVFSGDRVSDTDLVFAQGGSWEAPPRRATAIPSRGTPERPCFFPAKTTIAHFEAKRQT
jgi:hypothetical protein